MESVAVQEVLVLLVLLLILLHSSGIRWRGKPNLQKKLDCTFFWTFLQQQQNGPEYTKIVVVGVFLCPFKLKDCVRDGVKEFF